ncbi:hypothetical protein SH591_06165 [Sphingomonas sp. LY54]|uniref:hypothetical protein n=1 Tax=Sphingomonas sp. LY54 TaxID=3095343 RepID=UPI002D79FA1F|nr:hypothetical protein [Sphingomonas sp. LY54]WRP29764.1 hypothetical protein SH591_06165 [Sphingomonas sp. LY54]
MKRRNLLLTLAAFCALFTVPADAQRGRIRPTPEREAVAREAIRTAASFAGVGRQQRAMEILRTTAGLSSTPETFVRIQAALAILVTGWQPSRGVEILPSQSVFRTNLDGGARSNHFPFFVREDANGELRTAPIPRRVAVVDTIPEDPVRFAARFGRPMTRQDQGDVRQFKRQLLSSTAIHSPSLNAALQGPEKIVILTAHNEHGHIVNADGRGVPLKEMGEACARFGKLCFTVVCNSQRAVNVNAIGLVRDINIRRAGSLVQDLLIMMDNAQPNAEGNLRLPLTTVFEMMQRVDQEGGQLRLIGYRISGWFVVHSIILTPDCLQNGGC